MFITKLQTVHRQLSSAIELQFDNQDVVAVYSLTTLACRTLDEMIADSCPERLWSHQAAEVDHIDVTGYVWLDQKSREFLDPSTRRRRDWMEFSLRETEDLLFLAVMNASELGPLSIHESTYRLWYCATRAITLGASFPLVASAVRMFPHLYALDRIERLECGRRCLDHFLGRDKVAEIMVTSRPAIAGR